MIAFLLFMLALALMYGALLVFGAAMNAGRWLMPLWLITYALLFLSALMVGGEACRLLGVFQ